MKIFIEIPSWLGDAVMSTPAIENLANFFKGSEITLIGSSIAIEALKNHPQVVKTYILEKNYFILYKTIKTFDKYDISLSFRSSLRSKFLNFFITSNKKYQFNKNKFINGHQVEKYNNFVNDSISSAAAAGKLTLYNFDQNKNPSNKLLGINPGASYGNAKRWYPVNFAQVAIELSSKYDIIILGGANEYQIAADIEEYLIINGVKNYRNLANKTSINELKSLISNLDLLITGDSGPMHIAAAFQVPTVAIFGPTDDKKTCQWMNKKSIIVRKNLECQPCMKRTCPLKHHNCMKLISSTDVLSAVKRLD